MEFLGHQQQAWDAINTLSKRIDRFIAGQANGHNGESSSD